MQIQIRLVGLFKTERSAEQIRCYPDGSRVTDVVVDLALPQQHLGIVLINGLHAEPETELANGDTLTLIPLVDGG